MDTGSPSTRAGSLAVLLPFLDGRLLLGIEREAVELCNELALRGWRVEVVTSTVGWHGGTATDPDELLPAVELTRVRGHLRSNLAGFQPSGAPLVIPGLRKHIMQHDACIVYNAGWPLSLALSGLLRTGVTLLYRTYWHPPRGRREWLNGLRRRAAGLALGRADLLLTPTVEEGRMLCELGLAEESRVRAVAPAVAEPVCGAVDRSEARRQIGVPEDSLLVTQIGSPGKFKGTPALVEAVRLLRSRAVDIHLALVGRADHEALADLMLDEPWVHRLGSIPEVQKSKVLRVTDAVAMVSEYESFGFAALEALAHDVCPVIYDDFPSARELCRSGAIGVDREDGTEVLAVALLDACSTRVSSPQRPWTMFVDEVVATLAGGLRGARD